MSHPHPLDGGSRTPLDGVPLDLYRLARRLRQAKWADLLGRPRTEAAILQGRFPLAPERVLTLSATAGPVPAAWEEAARTGLPRSKLLGMIDLMGRMAAHYDPACHTEAWTRGLIRREALASSAIGRGFALVHQFQPRAAVAVAQPPVDWWLILCPDGIEWDALDGGPVYGMFAHVFADRERPGLELRVYEKSCRLARAVDWKALAARPPVEAARALNRKLLELVVGC